MSNTHQTHVNFYTQDSLLDKDKDNIYITNENIPSNPSLVEIFVNVRDRDHNLNENNNSSNTETSTGPKVKFLQLIPSQAKSEIFKIKKK